MKKENPTWKCRTCKKSIRRSRSILCEHCLLWSHFTCSKVKEKLVTNWFCMKCREMFREGNTFRSSHQRCSSKAKYLVKQIL